MTGAGSKDIYYLLLGHQSVRIWAGGMVSKRKRARGDDIPPPPAAAANSTDGHAKFVM